MCDSFWWGGGSPGGWALLSPWNPPRFNYPHVLQCFSPQKVSPSLLLKTAATSLLVKLRAVTSNRSSPESWSWSRLVLFDESPNQTTPTAAGIFALTHVTFLSRFDRSSVTSNPPPFILVWQQFCEEYVLCIFCILRLFYGLSAKQKENRCRRLNLKVEVGLKPCSCLHCLQLILQGYRNLHYYLDLTNYTFLTVVFTEEC